MTRTRVLWVTKGLGRGGAEQLLSSAAPRLQSDGFEVEVAYVLPWKDALVPRLKEEGIPVHCLGRGRATVSWVPRLAALVRSGRFDVVHTHSPLPAAVVRAASVSATTAVVHTEHNVWQRYRRPSRVLNAATYGRNRAVIAVSGGVAQSIRKPSWMPWVHMPRVEVVHHGIDERLVARGADARAHARGTLGVAPDAEIVGTVANFTPKKDQWTLLEAVHQLVPRHPRLRLVMVGSGPLEEQLRARARALGLDQRVLFTGSRDDVQALLPAFDVFVLSSLHEGLSIALVEAMAAGLPCVATRVGGIPEVIRDEREGVLVPPQEPAALARPIGALLEDPRRRAQMAAAATASAQRFSIANAVHRIEELYDEVLALTAERSA